MHLVSSRRAHAAIAGTGLALVAIVALGHEQAFSGPKPSPLDIRLAPIEVHARPLAAFDRMAPEKTRFGKLTWRGGLVLTSPSPSFGGWSGLVLGTNGSDFLSISDAGTWMSGRIVYDQEKPAGMTGVQLGPLQSRSGETLKSGRDRDAEGLALLSGTPTEGEVLVSFERRHRIDRFDVAAGVLSATKGSIDLPAAARSLPGNSGLEAIAAMRGGKYKGSLVAFAESRKDDAGDHVGWLWVDGRPQELYLTNPADFDVTDAAPLPDGSLLVLERRYRPTEGVKARLRLIRRGELRPGAHIDAETLLEAGLNQEIDNMEGLAAHAGAGGEIIVTLISDDNFNKGLQRTLLLQFALDDADLASTQGIAPRRGEAN